MLSIPETAGQALAVHRFGWQQLFINTCPDQCSCCKTFAMSTGLVCSCPQTPICVITGKFGGWLMAGLTRTMQLPSWLDGM